jgi:NTP pyrophosphatase (non-canonical NTP hydrolase)
MVDRPMYLYEKYTLDEWQKHLDRIYGARNRTRTNSETWYRMLEEIGEVLQAARPPNLSAIETTLPDLFVWLAALADVENVSLTDAVGNRFAYGCPYCGAKENCSCIYYPDRSVVQPRPIETDTLLFAPLKEKPLDVWVKAFDQLYGVTNRDRSLMDIISRLVENAGEVAKALREKVPHERLEAKLANVFAWIVATYIKYSSIVGPSAPSFAELVMRKYAHCAKCHSIPCECKPLVGSILVGIASGDVFGADEEIENVASREHLLLEIVQDRDEETFKDFQEKLAEVVILRKARDADAAAIVVTQMVTTALQSLVYQSLVRGQPVRVFSRVVQEHDLELGKFIEKARTAGVLVEFRDNASLSREFRAWLRSMPLVVR